MRALPLLLLTGCASLDFSGTSSAARTQLAPQSQPPPTGSAPANLSLKRLSGDAAWSLSQDRGSVVLLDVWATWCEPCREALPLYEALSKEFGERGLKVYAVSVDEDPSQIAKFLNEIKITVPVLVDPGALNSETVLHVKLMPTAFLIDRKGVIREVHEGFSDDARAKYQTQIEALLAESP